MCFTFTTYFLSIAIKLLVADSCHEFEAEDNDKKIRKTYSLIL